MRRIPRCLSLLLGLLLLPLLAALACAGQVRINVGGTGNVFVPAVANLNLGDQVIWVWMGGQHSVTSGSTADCTFDGVSFQSGRVVSRAGADDDSTAFSWKAPLVANSGLDYLCEPHCPFMAGILKINAAHVAVADFRITEVETNVAGGLDLIEVTNLGDADGDLGRYRFVANNDTATVPRNTWTVHPAQRVVVHVAASGAQAAPGTLFLPTLQSLDDSGTLGLYAPNTLDRNPGRADMMIDFVEWGAASQTREATAVTAGLWTAGQAVAAAGAGHALQFCGISGQHGTAFWSEEATPTFGAPNGCTTPALPVSWGRLKVIYR